MLTKMTSVLIVKILTLALSATIFFFYGLFHSNLIIGLIFSVVIILLILLLEKIVNKISTKNIICSIVGLSIGLLFANLILVPLYLVHYAHIKLLVLFSNTLFGFTGLIIGFKEAHNFSLKTLIDTLFKKDIDENCKLIDTSALIDGRIAEIMSSGFVEGKIIIPQFILLELQKIADSPDYVRRNRGRIGLDTLQRLKSVTSISLNIIYDDFADIVEIDSKLIALAQKYKSAIITTDLNLNKVATLQNVKVLNVNDLANALKPTIRQGDVLSIFVSKLGKEQGQGVGYTDDGTMVVIEDGAIIIGSSVEVVVGSVIQTSSGRIIFAKIKNSEHVDT